ncbi:hypothetical protein GCM10026987_13880 [Belliella aquatica]|uniref:Uncharacterized protein n=1 Tax=Belliella aquatica TaxID=1323734 RepID=A0ABQ1LKM6_9BACT|nr:hypothetical protein GCM10010993_01340 [Belliella aquatica]
MNNAKPKERAEYTYFSEFKPKNKHNKSDTTVQKPKKNAELGNNE